MKPKSMMNDVNIKLDEKVFSVINFDEFKIIFLITISLIKLWYLNRQKARKTRESASLGD